MDVFYKILHPSGAWQQNAKKEPFCLPVVRKTTAKHSVFMLLRLRFSNEHHSIQLPELFIVIQEHVAFGVFDIKISVFDQ